MRSSLALSFLLVQYVSAFQGSPGLLASPFSAIQQERIYSTTTIPTQQSHHHRHSHVILKSGSADDVSNDDGSTTTSLDDAEDTAMTSLDTNPFADVDPDAPQVFASGFSSNANLVEAINEAVEMAVQALPEPPTSSDETPMKPVIDLAIVSVSSLYDGGVAQPATIVIPTILEATQQFYGAEISNIIGSSVAGLISSQVAQEAGDVAKTMELEGIPAVSVVFGLLPQVELRTFTCGKADVPDAVGGRQSPEEWKKAVGLAGFGDLADASLGEEEDVEPVFMMLPSPAFAPDLDDLLYGLSYYFPGSRVFGGVSSTVSSLSRAKLYLYNSKSKTPMTYTDGVVGIAMAGDIQVQSLSAQGAKPVGGIYKIVKGSESTIQALVLDEEATAALDLEEEEEEDEEDEENMDAKARMAQAYAKARIPKPPLAEANFLMRTLSDDDQAFMRRQLLIGLEQGSSVGRSASDLVRLAEGQGHRFRVYQVASGGMKDGSVTFALGSVDITPGTRARFFVREAGFAKREVEALWLGYKKRLLDEQFGNKLDTTMSPPTCCFIVPTLDRGSKFFLGKNGYESNSVTTMLPSVPCVSGFYGNGVIGKLDVDPESPIGVQGSASGYFLLSSKSGRPIYSSAVAAAEKAAMAEQAALDKEAAKLLAVEDEKRRKRTMATEELSNNRAPRSEDGELIIKRREVHSGRAMTVSTVAWSVAEKTATPTSALEGFMWEKETEVDRFRERVPLANLVSQCRLSAADPTLPKPRDFMAPVKQVIQSSGFVIIPECKRMEPSLGSLRRRYDVEALSKIFTIANAPAICVNCDGVLFGGNLEDVTKARGAASTAAIEQMSEDGVIVPPVLASDLLLYPYQLYKMSLAGADAVNLVVGALPKKDLTYLIKIASSLKIQSLAMVTSEVQLESLAEFPEGSISAVVVSNRELEDFSFDMTGEQALRLLKSSAMEKVKEKHGVDIPVLVEGRIGIIQTPDNEGNPSPLAYMEALKAAGANGCIMGGGLIQDDKDSADVLKELQDAISN